MRGLMFSDTMLKAAEERRKRVTRRLMNPQPHPDTERMVSELQGDCNTMVYEAGLLEIHRNGKIGEGHKFRLKPGEVVYLKEPYHVNHFAYYNHHVVYYRAIDPHPYDAFNGKWENKMFMPARFARLYAVIRDVSAERIGDITPQEIEIEGTPWADIHGSRRLALMQGWIRLWNSIHGKNAWERDNNKWGWRYSFELIQTGILRKVVKE